MTSLSNTDRVLPPQSGRVPVSRRPSMPDATPHVQLQHVASCPETHWQSVQPRAGGKPADHFTPPSSSSCRLWVGRKVTKRRIYIRHIRRKCEGVSVSARPANVLVKTTCLCSFFIYLFIYFFEVEENTNELQTKTACRGKKGIGSCWLNLQVNEKKAKVGEVFDNKWSKSSISRRGRHATDCECYSQRKYQSGRNETQMVQLNVTDRHCPWGINCRVTPSKTNM